jgi:hypothetical protein
MFSTMKLLEQVVVVARRRRMAQNSIDAYCLWIRQFLAFSAEQLLGQIARVRRGDQEAVAS